MNNNKILWIARDKDNRLELYFKRPREIGGIFISAQGCLGQLPKSWYPEITLENSPKRVTLNIIDDGKV